MSFRPLPSGFAMRAIHAGQSSDRWSHRAVVPPIVGSTTFARDVAQLGSGRAEQQQFTYSRLANPTRHSLEQCLAAVEEARHALTYASGAAAVLACGQLLRAGDRVICAIDVYGGTYQIMNEVLRAASVQADFVRMAELAEFERLLCAETRLVWIESPTNPLLCVIDIGRVAAMVAEHRRKHGTDTLLVVDNTYLTAYLQRPLELGADVSMYSLTKFVNGHSDVTMGALVLNDDALAERLRKLQALTGIVPSPSDCSQVNRSLKTLALRMDQHRRSALAVARFLVAHPQVERVLHPALETHPQHQLALRQQHGHSGVFAFYVRGGDAEARRFLGALRMVTVAASFGGVHSLVGQPIRMMTGPFTPEDRAAIGITDNMIRLSVGLEDTVAVIEDLRQALNKMV